MSDSEHEPYESSNIGNMSAGQLLQKLYSYNESTGADIGPIRSDLETADVDTEHIIDLIDDNAETFQAPKPGSDDHFTNIVGKAREAADEGDSQEAANLLTNVIIGVISNSIDTFEEIEEEVESNEELANSIHHEVEYVRNSFEYMLELAETAHEKLTPSESQ